MIRLASAAWSDGTGVTAEATYQAALLIADSYPPDRGCRYPRSLPPPDGLAQQSHQPREGGRRAAWVMLTGAPGRDGAHSDAQHGDGAYRAGPAGTGPGSAGPCGGGCWECGRD